MSFSSTTLTVLISSLVRWDFHLYCSSSVFFIFFIYFFCSVSLLLRHYISILKAFMCIRCIWLSPEVQTVRGADSRLPLWNQKMDNGHADRLSDIDKHISCNSSPSSVRRLFCFFFRKAFFSLCPLPLFYYGQSICTHNTQL